MHSKLITLSGLDAAGKSTQIQLLSESFMNDGITPKVIWSRGGYTPGFEILKNLLRIVGKKKIVPPSGPNPDRTQAFKSPLVRKAWLSIAIFDLILLYCIKLRVLRILGKTIICDRFLWDTLVDFQINFPNENISHWLIWKLLVALSPKPDHAFLIIIPVEESLKRSDIKGEPFRDSKDVLEIRLEKYVQISKFGYWSVIDGTKSVMDIYGDISFQLSCS